MEKNILAGNHNMSAVRHELHMHHGFEPKELDHAMGIVGDAIDHVQHKLNTSRGLSADNLDTAMHFLNKDHKEWKALPSYKQEHIKDALEKHFGIEKPEAEVA